MIQGMEAYVGRKLSPFHINKYGERIKKYGYLRFCPNYYSENIHITMDIYFDEDYRISNFYGDKYYNADRGLYTRTPAYPRDFSKRDIAYLCRVVNSITVKEEVVE